MQVRVHEVIEKSKRATQSKLRRATPQDTMLKDLVEARSRADKMRIVEQFNPFFYTLFREELNHESRLQSSL